MSLFHRHQWRETQRVFTGPSGCTKIAEATQETAERLIWGITTILHRCDCGATRQDEIKGDARILKDPNGNAVSLSSGPHD